MDIQMLSGESSPLGEWKTSLGESPSLEILMDQVVLAQAADLARAGRYSEAESLLLEMTRSEEAVPAALDLLARIHAQQGRLAEASALWQRAIQHEPGNQAFTAALQRTTALQRPATRLRFLRATMFGLALGFILTAIGVWVLPQFPNRLTPSSMIMLTSTPTATPTSAQTPTLAPTSTQTPTATPTQTQTPTTTPTPTSTPTTTPTPTSTPTTTPTLTSTPTTTPTLTSTPTSTPTSTQTPTTTPTQTQTPTPIPTVGVVSGVSWLSLRTGPGINYPFKYGSMAIGEGAQLEIIATDSGKGCNNTWYKVVLPDGTMGWVCAAYVIIP